MAVVDTEGFDTGSRLKMVRAKGVEPSLPREPDPKSGAVILNTYFPSKYAACFQFVPINLPTFSELPAQLPAQKPVRTAPTQTSLIRCSKLIPNRRRGGFQLHALNSSIMDLGLENFWSKEGCLSGYLFLQYVFMLTYVIVYK